MEPKHGGQKAGFSMRMIILVVVGLGLSSAIASPIEFDDELSVEDNMTILDMSIAGHVLEIMGLRHDTESKLVRLDSLLTDVDRPVRRRIPTRDAWGEALFVWGEGYGMIIVSAGADGRLDHDYDLSTHLPVKQVLRGDDIIIASRQTLKVPLTNRGRQRRTMADLRSIGTAVEAFAVDHNYYPGPTNGIVLVETMREHLEPTYIRELPRIDAWERPFLFWSDGRDYMIVSLGSDGVEDIDYDGSVPPVAGLGREGTQGYEWDIIFLDGQFAQWPEGMQQ